MFTRASAKTWRRYGNSRGGQCFQTSTWVATFKPVLSRMPSSGTYLGFWSLDQPEKRHVLMHISHSDF